MGNTSTLHVLEVLGELEQVLNLFRGEVKETNEVATAKIDTHFVHPFLLETSHIGL